MKLFGIEWFSKKKKAVAASPFRFPMASIDFNEAEALGYGLEDVFALKQAGISVRNFLSAEECSTMVKRFEGRFEESGESFKEGMVAYPLGFLQYLQKVQKGAMSQSKVHQLAAQFREEFPAQFGVDFEKRLLGLLGTLWPKTSFKVAVDRKQEGSFFPFNIRKMPPGLGLQISYHTGLMFNDMAAGFYQTLNHLIDNEQQLSFFVVLQKSEGGGELTLYDLLWSEANTEPVNGVISTLNGGDIDLEDPTQISTKKLDLEAGTLLVFNGGDLWHRVEPLEGELARITLGGFGAPSPDGSHMYLWT